MGDTSKLVRLEQMLPNKKLLNVGSLIGYGTHLSEIKIHQKCFARIFLEFVWYAVEIYQKQSLG